MIIKKMLFAWSRQWKTMANTKLRGQLASWWAKDQAGLDDLYQLIDPIFSHSRSWTRKQLGQIFQNTFIQAYLVYEGSDKVGLLIFSDLGEELEILLVGVLEEFRKRGYGQTLMNLLHQTHPNKRFYLEVRSRNKPAICFYEENGFEVVHLRQDYYSQPPDHALIMVKEKEGIEGAKTNFSN